MSRLVLAAFLLLVLATRPGLDKEPSLANSLDPPDGHIIYVQLPDDVSAVEAAAAGPALKARLDALVEERMAALSPVGQDGTYGPTVQFTDQSGEPVLMDLALAR